MIAVTINTNHTIKLQIGWGIALFSKLQHFNTIMLTKIILQCTIFAVS